MIAKISKGCNIDSLINYHERKVENGLAKRIGHENSYTDNPDLLKAIFKELVKETKVEDYTFHVSLNLVPRERVSDERFKQIAKDYMDKLGYGSQPFVVYKHEDREHSHIHIVSVCIDENGRKINDFYEQKRSQEITRELELKYGLQMVSSNKVNNDYDEIQRVESLETRQGIKAFIAKATSEVKKKAKYRNYNELIEILKIRGIEAKLVKDTVQLDKVVGIVYKVDGDENGHIIKSSELYHTFSPQSIEKQFAKNETKYDNTTEQKARINKNINKILNRYYRLSEDDFNKELNKYGLHAIYARHKDGKTYGYKVYDYRSGLLFKGSEISRELSYNKIGEVLYHGVSVAKFDITRIAMECASDEYRRLKNSKEYKKESELIVALNNNKDFKKALLLTVVDNFNKSDFILNNKYNFNNFDQETICKKIVDDFIIYKNKTLYDVLSYEENLARNETINGLTGFIGTDRVNRTGLNDARKDKKNSKKNKKRRPNN